MAIELPNATQREWRQTDEELIRLISDRNSLGMEELMRRYQRPIHRFLTRFLDSAEDAEQTTLNVFIQVWEHAPRFRFQAKVSTWLYRIAFNQASDLHKRRKRRPAQEGLPEDYRLSDAQIGNAEADAMRRMERQEQYRQLQRCLSQMQEMDRLLLVLYYFEDATYEDMEKISGLSYKVLKTRLTRARQRLRALMESES